MKLKDFLYRGALLLATIIWGAAFVVMKNTLDTVPTSWLLTIRFLGAALLLALLFLPRLKNINKDYIAKGAICGTFLFAAYYSQTVGLTYTTPGKNAFLTAAYCIIVPFLGWVVLKRRPDRSNIAAAVICIVGIGCVSLTDSLTPGVGDLLSLLCAFFFAQHMLCLDAFTKERDPLLLTIIQFAVTGLWSLLAALITEDISEVCITRSSILSLGYLCVFSTAAGMLLQAIGQKETPATSASIILSLEAVFGIIFSVIFYHEVVTLRMAIGFALIMAAILISETKLLNKKTI